MSRKNRNSARRAHCPHCKIKLNSNTPHRKNCLVKNNETGWPVEVTMERMYGRAERD